MDAMERAPDNLSLRNNLGLSLVLGGDVAEAIALLRETAAIPRRHPADPAKPGAGTHPRRPRR
jgi:Flp pilus assembly protein TadD